MPFTFSHPGFALPIKKWKPAWFSTTGFFFGSIAPDMDIILRLTNQRIHIFNYDLYCVVFYIFPIALLLSVYYHLIVRDILIDHLPEPFAAQFAPYKNFSFLGHLKKNIPSVILSIFLSIYLHLFLDMISHFDATPFRIYGGIVFLNMGVSMAYYYGVIYLPALLLSFGGFYLILQYNKISLRTISRAVAGLLSNSKILPFYLCLAGLSILIAATKTLFGGLEKGFIIDTLIINLTNGCLVSGIITPALYFIVNKIKKVS